MERSGRILAAMAAATVLVGGILWLADGTGQRPSTVAPELPVAVAPASSARTGLELAPVPAEERPSSSSRITVVGSDPGDGLETEQSRPAARAEDTAVSGFVVSGRVMELDTATTFRAVPGARLILRGVLGVAVVLEVAAKAGEAGEFSMPADALVPFLEPKRFPAFAVTLGAVRQGYRPEEVGLRLSEMDESGAEVEVQLSPIAGRSLQLRLVDAEGEGVAGVRLRAETLRGSNGSVFRGQYLANLVGVCMVRDLPLTGTLVGEASDSEHGRWSFRVELESIDGTADLGDLYPEPSGVLAGRLTDRGRVALERVELTARRAAAPGELGTMVLTERDGSFRIAGLSRADTYALHWPGAPEEVELFRPTRTHLQLISQHYGLTVEVVGTDGRAEPRARLEVRGAETDLGVWNRHDGTYSVRSQAAGPIEISAVAEIGDDLHVGQLAASIGEGLATAKVVLREKRKVRLSLAAFGPGGARLREFHVALCDPITGADWPFTKWRAGERATLEVAPGTYVARIQPAAGTPVLPFEAEIDVPDVSEWEVDLRAPERGSLVTIEVEGWNEADQAIAFLVGLSADSEESLVDQYMVDRPTFTMRRSVPPGSYEVWLLLDPHAEESRTLKKTLEITGDMPPTVRFRESLWR